jgi:aminopeptidase N
MNIFFIQLILSLIFSTSYNNAVNHTDVISYHIHISNIDFEQKTMAAHTSIVFRHYSTQAGKPEFSLIGYQIDSCFLDGERIRIQHRNDSLIFDLPENNAAKKWQLDVFYQGSPVSDKYWGGFFIENDIAYNYGVGMAAEPPVFGRAWFPSHDVFTDRAAFYFTMDVSQGFVAVANGTLQSVLPKNQKMCYKYTIKDSIPSYLASIAIGKFDVLQKQLISIRGNLPFEAFFPQGDKPLAEKTFTNMQAGFSAYEKLFGPYVWDRVGYVATPFHGGAMEHATNIAYSRACHVYGCESTIYHELSHHWFGNLVTCATEKDMWLNEGWASYCEYLYFEKVFGAERAQQHLAKLAHTALKLAPVNDGAYIALNNPNHDQTYGTNIYKKGALMVHNLRSVMGDSLFFSTIQAYLSHFAFKSVTIEQLKQYFQEKSRQNLENYFSNWIYQTGYPNFLLHNTVSLKQKTGYQLSIQISQQLLARENYAQSVPIPVIILDEKLQEHSHTIICSGKNTHFTVNLPFEPKLVIADPYNSICDAQFSYKRQLRTGDFWQNDDIYIKLFAHKVSRDSLPIYITYHFTAPNDSLNQNKLYTEFWRFSIPDDFNQQISVQFLMVPQFKYRKLYYRANPNEKWLKLQNECTTKDMEFKVGNIRSGEYVFGDM